MKGYSEWSSTNSVFSTVWNNGGSTNLCLAEISQWMTARQLKLNLDETEQLSLPGTVYPIHDLSINIENTVVSLAWTVSNLGMTLNDQLSFTVNIAVTTRSCRLILSNIRSLLHTQEVVQFLVKALVISCIDYYNSHILSGLSAPAHDLCRLIQKPSWPLSSHTTSILHTLPWPPVASWITFVWLIFGCHAAKSPACFRDLGQTCFTPREEGLCFCPSAGWQRQGYLLSYLSKENLFSISYCFLM